MEPLLDLLQKDSRRTPEQLAELLGRSATDVRTAVAELEAAGTILGYHAVIDPEKSGNGGVTALIEVRLTPERGGGFDRLAERIAKFDQVISCWLMSGGYDLAVVVRGETLRDVARFVAEKLSTLGGVLSTATHFQLKTYKQSGFAAKPAAPVERLAVSP